VFSTGPTYQRGSVPTDGFFTSHTLPVTGRGILPFYTVCSSDHTAVWMSTSVFQSVKEDSKPFRRLQLQNKQGVQNYVSHLKRHVTDTLDDEQLTKIMVESEHRCCRVRTGGLDSSPELT